MTNRYVLGIFLLLWYTVAAQDPPVPPTEAYANFLHDAMEEDPVDVTVLPDVLIGESYLWKASTGKYWTWNGGPEKSSNGSEEVEYYVFDTSQFVIQTQNEELDKVGTLPAEQNNATGMSGVCLSFWYNTKGSIIKSFDMVLAEIIEDVHLRQPTGDVNSSDTDPTQYTRYGLLWTAPENTNGEWMPMSQTYVSPYPHQIGWGTVPKTTADLTKERGYTAIENIQMWTKPCPGDCLFIKDTCSWTIEGNGPMEWTIGRGPASLISGPVLDYPSSKRIQRAAGYVYLDTSYPARTDDSSRMVSIPLIPPQIANVPYCLRFKALFYGAQDMGYLRVILQNQEEDASTNTTMFVDKQILWSFGGRLSSPSFNRLSWVNIEVPVAWNEETIQIVIEGTVGKPGRSNIAIDSLRLNQMSCMLLPEIGLAEVPLVLDCSFGVGTCAWTPEGMWGRVAGIGTLDEPYGHTDLSRTFYPGDYYMAANLRDSSFRNGEWSTLTSVKFEPINHDICISFWYFMFSKAPMYASLGGIRVIVEERLESGSKSSLIWSLDNHQGDTWLQAYTSYRSSALEVTLKFDVVTGTGRSAYEVLAIDDISVYPRLCTAFPEQAKADLLDCDFYKDTCSWNILNPDGLEEDRFNWRLATKLNHLDLVNDNTLKLPYKAYMFIDSASTGINSHLLISDDLDIAAPNVTKVNCLTFWFRTYNFETSASLSVAWNVATDTTNTIVWRYPNLAEQNAIEYDLTWTYAQVEIPAIEGEGKKVRIMARVRSSAIALDDIKYYRDSNYCPTRPESAAYVE